MPDKPDNPDKPGGGGKPKGVNSKLGPLPLWMWAVIAGGGVAAVLYLRSRGKPGGGKTTATGGGCCTNGAPADASGNCPDGQAPSQYNCAQVSQTQLAIVPVPTPTGTPAPAAPGAANAVGSTNGAYVVKKGDTWASIAKNGGSTPQDLFYYQFSDAASGTTTQAMRAKLAEFGPNSIIPGNVISYPTNGTYPKYSGFSYYTSSPNFWPSPGTKSKAAPAPKKKSVKKASSSSDNGPGDLSDLWAQLMG